MADCRLTLRACLVEMQRDALEAFEDYATARRAEGLILEKHESDFEDSTGCANPACLGDCKSAFNDCFKECGASAR